MSGQVSGIRYQVSGIRYQVLGTRYQVTSIRHHVYLVINRFCLHLARRHHLHLYHGVPGVRCQYQVSCIGSQVSGVRCFVSSTCYKCPSSPPPLSPSPLPSPCRRAAETPGKQILFRVKTNLDRHFNKSCLLFVRNAHRLLLLRVDVRPLGVRHLALPVGETSGDQVVR